VCLDVLRLFRHPNVCPLRSHLLSIAIDAAPQLPTPLES
jgi:hypothetical protein